MAARTYEDLMVWQKAHEFVLGVYRLTGTFPKEELFGLRSQMRRAAVSIPANIAEGFARRGKADKSRFYNVAQASLKECRYYLRLANDLGYGDTRHLREQIDEVSRMLESYASSVRTSSVKTWAIGAALVTPGFWLLASGFFWR